MPASTRRSARSGADEPLILASDDGSLTYRLRPTNGNLYMERMQRSARGTCRTKSIVFEHAEDFLRWCESDPVRFDHPVLYQSLRRHGDGALRVE